MRISLLLFAFAGIAASPAGDLCQPAYSFDFEIRDPKMPYEPQAGDIVFFNTEGDKLWDFGFKFAMAGRPDHSGIVVKMPDGTFGVIESGPDDSLKVEVCSLAERLRFHACNRGRVWIRRRKCPISEEQSCRLTQFAISERGKRYTIIRLGAQITPLRSRGPLRTYVMGKPLGPHRAYFCSEVVLEAAVFAGIMDKETTRPRATYPEDFFLDRSRNLYLNSHFSLACSWYPPQRLCFDDCPLCKAPKGTFWKPNPDAIPVHPYFLGH